MEQEAVNYIVLSIPIFFLLIGIELLVAKLSNSKLYRFNDAITNISCGLGQQILGVFLKSVLIIGYYFIYQHYRFFDIASSWQTWIILFIGVDFFYYWFHRVAHEVSVVWGSHVVHHQSEEYNLTVALRQGWVQGIFSTSFYLPLALIGFDPFSFLTINSFQTLYQFWIHTKTINKLPAPIEYIFNTPSHHRVHHGVNSKYIDRNHGGTLIIFDRLFGTFQEEEETVVYGVTQQPNSWNPLWLNIEYWVWMVSELKAASKWSDKFNILFNTPGWTPQSAKKTATPSPSVIQNFQKYDTEVPMGLNYYVLLQYMVLLFGATAFLFLGNNFELLPRITIVFIIIASLVNLGAIFEAKKWLWYAEPLRLLLGSAFVLSVFSHHSLVVWISITVAFYLLSSLVWLSGYSRLFKRDFK